VEKSFGTSSLPACKACPARLSESSKRLPTHRAERFVYLPTTRDPGSLSGALEHPVVPEHGTVSWGTMLPHKILAATVGVSAVTIAGARSQEPATRNPLLLFSFVGLLLLRFDDCRLLDVLFQLPPRSTRDSAAVSFPDIPQHSSTQHVSAQSPTLGVLGVGDPRFH
jgi:hypothetical protein